MPVIWWRSRIDAVVPELRADGLYIETRTGDHYDIRACYDQAREHRDAFRAPHLAFRNLKHDDLFAATNFLRRFGPLESCHERWVNLDDFWCKHARFVAVAGLWEGFRKDARELRSAWLRMSRLADQVSESETQPLRITAFSVDGKSCSSTMGTLSELVTAETCTGVNGASESGGAIEDLEDAISEYKFHISFGKGFAWKENLGRFVEWARRAPISTLRDSAVVLIQGELNNHLGSRLARWDRLGDEDRLGFRPVFDNMSLWSAMWEFFGLDTSDGIGWRICPHCGKPFYPPRKDRFYCTSRQQQLHSKRQWWDRNRRAARPKK